MRAARQDHDLNDSEFESILGHQHQRPNDNRRDMVHAAHGRARSQRGFLFLAFFGIVAFFAAVRSGALQLDMNVKVGDVQPKNKHADAPPTIVESGSSSSNGGVPVRSTGSPIAPSPTQAKIVITPSPVKSPTKAPIKIAITAAPVVVDVVVKSNEEGGDGSPSPAIDAAAAVEITTEAPTILKKETPNPTSAPQISKTKDSGEINTILNSYNDNKGNPSKKGSKGVNDASYWGQWELTEHASFQSQKRESFCKNVQNCDVPNTAFPINSWQRDAKYVEQFLLEGLKLVNRTKEAIYAEYGAGYPLTEEIRQRREVMFRTGILNCTAAETSQDINKMAPAGGRGGWMCESSLDGLVRRILHAIITQDDFTIALGGHSVAAGHDNHFAQSYLHQSHRVLEPVFARLGIQLTSRNLAHGGLGTLQSSLGSGDIYGRENDILMWDSSMTESRGSDAYIELFHRQAVLSGNRVPFFLDEQGYYDFMGFAIKYDADVASFSRAGDQGFLVSTSEQQVKSLPWASQYHLCDPQADANFKQACNVWERKYDITCWVDRDDFTPPTKQLDKIRTSNHPRHQVLQAQGRGIAMMVLTGLEHALLRWRNELSSNSSNNNAIPLPSEEYWHVAEHYQKIRDNVSSDGGVCAEMLRESKMFPERVCTTPMKGRTQFTPRTNPDESSLLSIMKDFQPNSTKYSKELLYEGPDVPNPSLAIPEGEIDVRLIASTGKSDLNLVNHRNRNRAKRKHRKLASAFLSSTSSTLARNRNLAAPQIEQSSLWYPTDGLEVGFCDGSTDSYNCKRNAQNDCLLYGHNDDRQGIMGDGYSDWVVFNLHDVTEGIIMVKVHAWYHKVIIGKLNPLTEGMDVDGARSLLRGSSSSVSTADVEGDESWSSLLMSWESDEEDGLDYHYDQERYLKADPEQVMPDTFKFDFALNGKITTYDKQKFWEVITNPQRVVQLFTLLDQQPNWVQKNYPDGNVEVAFRLRDCGRDQMMHITHLYWA
eukprot:CAMPEP_0116031158 /NCGR_PEP_ID=MMETSP0321-20121206/17329_1 /TAXON_ID=163516 /ORGANISM="Leptocylindrus danicus var. danicus, Strain B650" /LENGTH=993 /DNA_ID=CAMNT_0003506193 /DNA_START=61 /DNA_END=3042 /DNA_ORIENTATION=+